MNESHDKSGIGGPIIKYSISNQNGKEQQKMMTNWHQIVELFNWFKS